LSIKNYDCPFKSGIKSLYDFNKLVFGSIKAIVWVTDEFLFEDSKNKGEELNNV
jgi:hypothetical protein